MSVSKKRAAPKPPPGCPSTGREQNKENEIASKMEEGEEKVTQKPVDALITLKIVLPDQIFDEIQISSLTPLIDLRTQLCAKYKFSAGSHRLEPIDINGRAIPFTSSSTLASTSAKAVHLKPKSKEPVKITPPKVVEQTVRLTIKLSPSNLQVIRVRPSVGLNKLLPLILDKTGVQLEDHRYLELRHPEQTTMVLDMSRSIDDYNIREIFVADKRAQSGMEPEATSSRSSDKLPNKIARGGGGKKSKKIKKFFRFSKKAKSSAPSDSTRTPSTSPIQVSEIVINSNSNESNSTEREKLPKMRYATPMEHHEPQNESLHGQVTKKIHDVEDEASREQAPKSEENHGDDGEIKQIAARTSSPPAASPRVKRMAPIPTSRLHATGKKKAPPPPSTPIVVESNTSSPKERPQRPEKPPRIQSTERIQQDIPDTAEKQQQGDDEIGLDDQSDVFLDKNTPTPAYRKKHAPIVPVLTEDDSSSIPVPLARSMSRGSVGQSSEKEVSEDNSTMGTVHQKEQYSTTDMLVNEGPTHETEESQLSNTEEIIVSEDSSYEIIDTETSPDIEIVERSTSSHIDNDVSGDPSLEQEVTAVLDNMPVNEEPTLETPASQLSDTEEPIVFEVSSSEVTKTQPTQLSDTDELIVSEDSSETYPDMEVAEYTALSHIDDGVSGDASLQLEVTAVLQQLEKQTEATETRDQGFLQPGHTELDKTAALPFDDEDSLFTTPEDFNVYANQPKGDYVMMEAKALEMINQFTISDAVCEEADAQGIQKEVSFSSQKYASLPEKLPEEIRPSVEEEEKNEEETIQEIERLKEQINLMREKKRKKEAEEEATKKNPYNIMPEGTSTEPGQVGKSGTKTFKFVPNQHQKKLYEDYESAPRVGINLSHSGEIKGMGIANHVDEVEERVEERVEFSTEPDKEKPLFASNPAPMKESKIDEIEPTTVLPVASPDPPKRSESQPSIMLKPKGPGSYITSAMLRHPNNMISSNSSSISESSDKSIQSFRKSALPNYYKRFLGIDAISDAYNKGDINESVEPNVEKDVHDKEATPENAGPLAHAVNEFLTSGPIELVPKPQEENHSSNSDSIFDVAHLPPPPDEFLTSPLDLPPLSPTSNNYRRQSDNSSISSSQSESPYSPLSPNLVAISAAKPFVATVGGSKPKYRPMSTAFKGNRSSGASNP